MELLRIRQLILNSCEGFTAPPTGGLQSLHQSLKNTQKIVTPALVFKF